MRCDSETKARWKDMTVVNVRQETRLSRKQTAKNIVPEVLLKLVMYKDAAKKRNNGEKQ